MKSEYIAVHKLSARVTILEMGRYRYRIDVGDTFSKHR